MVNNKLLNLITNKTDGGKRIDQFIGQNSELSRQRISNLITNGTAYVVGGLGGSVYNRGGVTIATIKTGAGLRVGANVGYIKFSENPKWLPF